MLISVTLFGDIRIAKAIIGLNQNSHSLIDKEQEGAIRTKEDEDDIFSRLKILSSYAPDKLEDINFLKETDKELNDNQAGLLIRKMMSLNIHLHTLKFLRLISTYPHLKRKDKEKEWM